MQKEKDMILSYLRKNPRAADTLEGIARWWLEKEKIDHSIDIVRDALEDLAKDGRVRKKILKDGTIVYQGAQDGEGDDFKR